MNPSVFKFLKNDKTVLERNPLEQICKINKLGAYRHNDFWQCMDTLRDKEILETYFKKRKNLKKKILILGRINFSWKKSYKCTC